MKLLLKDCGLAGFRGAVRRCADCGRPTVHFHRAGFAAVCGVCGSAAQATERAPDAPEMGIIIDLTMRLRQPRSAA